MPDQPTERSHSGHHAFIRRRDAWHPACMVPSPSFHCEFCTHMMGSQPANPENAAAIRSSSPSPKHISVVTIVDETNFLTSPVPLEELMLQRGRSAVSTMLLTFLSITKTLDEHQCQAQQERSMSTASKPWLNPKQARALQETTAIGVTYFKYP